MWSTLCPPLPPQMAQLSPTANAEAGRLPSEQGDKRPFALSKQKSAPNRLGHGKLLNTGCSAQFSCFFCKEKPTARSCTTHRAGHVDGQCPVLPVSHCGSAQGCGCGGKELSTEHLFLPAMHHVPAGTRGITQLEGALSPGFLFQHHLVGLQLEGRVFKMCKYPKQAAPLSC